MIPESQTAPRTDGEADFYGRLVDILADGQSVALCTVIRLLGSGPRRAGAKMVVHDGSVVLGTVGGGLLEAHATAWAREAEASGRAVCRSFALDRPAPSDTGMTCGGRADVLVEVLDGRSLAVGGFFREVERLAAGGRGVLVTLVRGEERLATARFLVSDGRTVASLPSSAGPLPAMMPLTPATPTLLEQADGRYFVEPLVPPITVYVFGAGHIGLHLVPLCRRLGFRTVVVDDRADFASRERFPDATGLVVAASFERALEDLDIDKESYLVIVTRGHGADAAVLGQALRRGPGYIGMIGSARKRGLIFDELLHDGVAPGELARVSCPIGLPIGAETPEEIAVSIAAELIATRAGLARTIRENARE